jgi:hypothetical protein
LGDFERVKENAMLKRVIRRKSYSKSRKGRSRMRWLDGVENGLKKMKVKG